MIGFAERVLAYTEGFTQAAAQIPEEIRDGHSEIPWRQIIATRNRLIHGYLGIDNDTLWRIIQADIPSLLGKLESMRELYGK